MKNRMSGINKRAWQIRKLAASIWACPVSEILWGPCFRQAKEEKMETTVYYAPGGKWSTEEPKVWIYAYGVSDPEEFIEHMKKYHSIPAGPYSRDIYEKVCKEFGVEPVADEDFHPYGMEYGDFGNAHYHTVPENRPLGIANSIHQQRFFGIKKENAAQKKKEDLPPITYGKEGQLWEPCERCGKEPVYMPLHLCDDCWPG